MSNTAKSLSGPTISREPQIFHHFIQTHCYAHETKEQKELREEIETLPEAIMCGAPDEAQFFAFLVKTCGWKKVIEVGVFRGYTTLTVAMALPKDGQLVALDITDDYTKTAYKYW